MPMLDDKLATDALTGWVVLAVDDHPASLEIITDVLSYYGAQVETANNGQEGLARARELKPKLIISDIAMPIMDGWGLIRRLKEDDYTRHIPVIALTAHAMKGDREVAMAQGFHNHLTKPLDPFTFMRQILVLLEDIPGMFDDSQPKLEKDKSVCQTNASS